MSKSAKKAPYPSVRVSAAAADAAHRGHPWVFRETAIGSLPPGQVVRIEGPRGLAGWGLSDDGAIAIRVLGGAEPPDDFARWLTDRISRSDRARTRLLPPETDGYRVINGDGDGLEGVVVDRYSSLAVVRLYSAAWVPWLEVMSRAIQDFGWVSTIYRRLGVDRVDGRKSTDGEVLVGELDEVVVYREHGMKLLVRPRVGQKTGMFLDQRTHRAMIRQWASGRMVANLFAYNGGFSVAAALGGAAYVTTVDLAPEAVEDAQENFRLNGLDPNDHAFEVADAFAWQPTGALDLLIVDPPSMARTRKAASAARRAYEKLHRRLGPFVARDGLMASSSCTARMTSAEWERAVADGLASSGAWSWHWRSSEPVDHPVGLQHREGRYLKFALLRRR